MTWIDASKHKPETHGLLGNASYEVLVRTEDGMHFLAVWSLAHRRWIGLPSGTAVTHWMKIPPIGQ